MKYPYLVLFISIFLSACGSSNNTQSKSDIWYSDYLDQYFVISSKGETQILQCTLNDGYQARAGIQMTIFENEFRKLESGVETSGSVSRDGDVMHLSGIFRDLQLLKVDEVPEVCQNNAIEIVSITPESFILGQEATLSITLDYRLVDEGTKVIELGYSESSHEFIIVKSIEIDQVGSSTYSFTYNLTPSVLDDGSSFRVSAAAHLKPSGEGKEYKLLYWVQKQLDIEKSEVESLKDCLACVVNNPSTDK